MGPGIHLLGDKMIKRLRLDYERGCFLYQDPLDGTEKECGGVMQIQIGVERGNQEVNKLPFLPIRIKTKSSKAFKTYRASCKKCVIEENKGLCKHNMSQRMWRETYTCEEVAYAVVHLNYKLIAIEEALVYPEKDYIFTDFMKILASKKIRFGAVPKNYKNNITKYCQDINEAMCFENEMDKLTPDILSENSYQCAFIKGLMNMGIGWSNF